MQRSSCFSPLTSRSSQRMKLVASRHRGLGEMHRSRAPSAFRWRKRLCRVRRRSQLDGVSPRHLPPVPLRLHVQHVAKSVTDGRRNPSGSHSDAGHPYPIAISLVQQKGGKGGLDDDGNTHALGGDRGDRRSRDRRSGCIARNGRIDLEHAGRHSGLHLALERRSSRRGRHLALQVGRDRYHLEPGRTGGSGRGTRTSRTGRTNWSCGSRRPCRRNRAGRTYRKSGA